MPVTRFIQAWSIGWSADWPARRNVGWVSPEAGGWAGFVAAQVAPLRAANPTLPLLLHNPFGALAGENMQLTQYQQARAAGLTWLTDEFVAAVRPLARAGEVIVYLGTQDGDHLIEAAATYAEKVRLIREAIRPAIDAGCSIAFDAASGYPTSHAAFHEMERLRRAGKRVYIEAWPLESTPHLHPYPAIATVDFVNHPGFPTWGIRESQDESLIWNPHTASTPADVAAAAAAGRTLIGGMTVSDAGEYRAPKRGRRATKALTARAVARR